MFEPVGGTQGLSDDEAKAKGAEFLYDDLRQRVAQDFSQQHQADQKLADKDREGYTLLLAMRSWEFEAFAKLRR